MITARKINKDIHKIYRKEMKKTKWYCTNRVKKIKAIRRIQEKIMKYYITSIDSDVLINRVCKLNFNINHSYSLLMSIAFGILTGTAASIIIKMTESIDILELLKLGNQLDGSRFGIIPCLIWYGVVLIIAVAFISFPIMILLHCGRFLFMRSYIKDLEIEINKYEKAIILSKLQYEYNFQMESLNEEKMKEAI